ncbi:MAG: hypothetical protein KU29_13870 [Sulfurovum sp. FS06-10]|nr:MAG: hypothetical protein KU29_13870 [Sulfurovum sp. FS06-10]
MYHLKLSSKARKFIVKRTPKEQVKLIAIFEALQENPYNNTLDTKPMKGVTTNHYRLRFGKYRFIYEVIDNELLIFVEDGDSRGDIYKK